MMTHHQNPRLSHVKIEFGEEAGCWAAVHSTTVPGRVWLLLPSMDWQWDRVWRRFAVYKIKATIWRSLKQILHSVKWGCLQVLPEKQKSEAGHSSRYQVSSMDPWHAGSQKRFPLEYWKAVVQHTSLANCTVDFWVPVHQSHHLARGSCYSALETLFYQLTFPEIMPFGAWVLLKSISYARILKTRNLEKSDAKISAILVYV